MPFGGKRNHTKSTGTTDEKLARKKAKEFYRQCLVASQIADGSLVPKGKPAPNATYRFDKIVDLWLDEIKERSKLGQRQHNHWISCKSAAIGNGGFALFFGKDDVNSITTDRVRQFIKFKTAKAPEGKLAGTTIQRNIVSLNSMLKFAREKSWLSTVPAMPKTPKQDNPRAWFEHKEYNRLHNAARAKAKAAAKNGDQAQADEWNELSDFIIFMVGSFLRPSEWPYIQHRHVSTAKQGQISYLNLAVVKGKTGMRQSVTMGTCVAAYERLVKRGGNDPQAYIFKRASSNRKTAQRRMADMLNTLLNDTGLKFDFYGQPRSSYSLRHTSLMLRALKGNVNPLTLAANAGTSVDQLERFYLKRIKNVDQIANLQSFVRAS